MKIVNLETGMPSVETARGRLGQELRIAKAHGERAVKIIHGYGSSGCGGAIKKEVQFILAQKKREGMVRDYVKGEDFSPFCETARRMVAQLPALSRDRDYSRGNDGVTIVLF